MKSNDLKKKILQAIGLIYDTDILDQSRTFSRENGYKDVDK